MKKMKKAVSMFLALAMIASMCAFSLGVSAENSQVTVLESDYAIADKLSALEIVNVVEDENLGNYVKRSDMISILTKYLRIEGVGLDGSGSPFLDVSYSDENIGAYRALYWGGYISGDENKMYRPNDLLTYNEAITFIINAMGYRPFAKRNGGYPAGYLYTANKYNLLSGLRGSGNNPIPFCDLYRIIEASVLANAVTYRYAINEEDSSFSLNENLSILEELYGYKYVKGVVTGNENTRLNDQDSTGIDRYQIRIGKTIYDTPGKEFGDYLGRTVYGYAKKDDFGNYDIVHVELVPGANKEFKLSADEIYKNKTTNTKIFYEDENYEEDYINLAGTKMSIVYNGKSITGETYGQLKDVMPDAGYILGVDNTGDSVVDVLFIYEYENFVVGAIDTIKYEITDKFIGTKKVKLDSYKDEVRIYDESGESLSFGDIKAGDVLSVMESMNSTDYKLIIAYKVGKIVEGSISEITDDKYKIGDEYYKRAENLKDYNALSPTPQKLLSVGLNATFFLDLEGKIANYETTVTTDLTYGFLAGVGSESGLDNRIYVKIYNQSGNWIEAEVAEKVRVDKKIYDITKSADFNTTKGTLENTTYGKGNVILYKLSGDKITEIDTATGDGVLTVVSDGTELFKRGSIAYEKGTMPRDSFIIKSDMLVFKTPDPAALLADTEIYQVQTGLGSKALFTSNASNDDNEKIDGYVAYKVGPATDVNAATCILLKNVASLQQAPNVSTAGSALSIYLETTEVIDKEGERRKKIYVLNNGEKQGYIVDETKLGYRSGSTTIPFNLTDANLGVGDIIQYSLNNITGMIENISIAYRTSGNSGVPAPALTTIPGGTFQLSYPYGGLAGATFVAADVENNAIMVYGTASSEVSGTGNLLFNISSATITLYNKSAKQETVISADGLIKDDLLIIRCSNYVTNATEILAIR